MPLSTRALFALWRRSRQDPSNPFARAVAGLLADALEAGVGPLAGQTVVDVGTGDGTYARAFADRGARVVAVEYDASHLQLTGTPPPGAVVGDGRRLPLAEKSVDGLYSGNVLEHTPTPYALLDELARVAKPGGWGYVHWTNWYSPWGGHGMSPYQYLGPRLGPRLYERRNGPPASNRIGEGLFVLHIAPVLRYLRGHRDWALVGVEPRYWPQHRWIVALPGFREVFTWNCAVRLVRRR